MKCWKWKFRFSNRSFLTHRFPHGQAVAELGVVEVVGVGAVGQVKNTDVGVEGEVLLNARGGVSPGGVSVEKEADARGGTEQLALSR